MRRANIGLFARRHFYTQQLSYAPNGANKVTQIRRTTQKVDAIHTIKITGALFKISRILISTGLRGFDTPSESKRYVFSSLADVYRASGAFTP